MARPAPFAVRHDVLLGTAVAGTAVALWHAGVDAALGQPGHVPRVVATVVARAVGGTAAAAPRGAAAVALYLAVVYGGAALITLAVMAVVHRARGQPGAALAAVLLTVLVQLVVSGVTGILVAAGWGSGAWWRLAAASCVGACATAWTAYRTHPDLRAALARADDE